MSIRPDNRCISWLCQPGGFVVAFSVKTCAKVHKPCESSLLENYWLSLRLWRNVIGISNPKQCSLRFSTITNFVWLYFKYSFADNAFNIWLSKDWSIRFTYRLTVSGWYNLVWWKLAEFWAFWLPWLTIKACFICIPPSKSKILLED